MHLKTAAGLLVILKTFADSVLLHLLLVWNLVTPSIRLRSLQSGLNQDLMTWGGLLHTFSLFMSLTTFVITSVMLGYHSVFLLPIPLTVTMIVLFVARSVVDYEFRTWSLGPKVSHCLLASIFPTTSPRGPTKVNIFINISRFEITFPSG